MTERVECAVIGAGVVGLAIARALAMEGREVVIVEAEERIGTGNSSRNSEVVHAGIYYPQGSLMARLCVAGRTALYEFCKSRNVAHEICGKLIVATSAEEAQALDAIRLRAAANGVTLEPVTAAEAQRGNPELDCHGALLSRLTGILDSHGFMLALAADIEAHGGLAAFNAPALGGRVVAAGVELDIGGREPMRLGCRWAINSAGLGATALACRIEGLQGAVPQTFFAKGNYFALVGQKAPFSKLVYPVPVAGGLGVHLTLDLAHQARFGPDVEWVDRPDWRVDPSRGERFYAAIRRYWPALRDGALQPAYCGVRPKLAARGAPAQDFCIKAQSGGAGGVVNLYGIESPGLTASLAIADHVAGLIAAADAGR